MLAVWCITPCILAGEDHRIDFIPDGGGNAMVRNFSIAYQILRCHNPEHHKHNIYASSYFCRVRGHYATSRMVARSIPDEVILFFI
jgi:hypothetical protein